MAADLGIGPLSPQKKRVGAKGEPVVTVALVTHGVHVGLCLSTASSTRAFHGARPPLPNAKLGQVVRPWSWPTYPSISTAKRTHDSSCTAVDLPRLITPVPLSAISSLRRMTSGFPCICKYVPFRL